MWRFATGRLRRTYDESADAVNEVQRAGPESLRLEPIDFGRRQAHDQDLASELAGHDTSLALMPNVIFDESGNFVLYATLLGIKVRLLTRLCARRMLPAVTFAGLLCLTGPIDQQACTADASGGMPD